MPRSDRRPPAGLVGIPRPLRSVATPTLPASELTLCGGCIGVSNGNGVLNQIPAGDGRESSREQVVPDDGAPVHRSLLVGRSQSDLPDPQKKKKKRGLQQPVLAACYRSLLKAS